MKEKPNLTASQTTRIATLLVQSVEEKLWPSVNLVLSDDETIEVNDTDLKRIFNTLKALL